MAQKLCGHTSVVFVFWGQFDAELAEKVSRKGAKLTVASFRCLALFGAELQQGLATNVAQASHEEATSLPQKERGDLALAGGGAGATCWPG